VEGSSQLHLRLLGLQCLHSARLQFRWSCSGKRQGARADIEVTLPPSHGPILLDMSMIHPRCPTYEAADSLTQSAAAALRDMSKQWAHAGHLDPSHTFVPASLDRYGHLGRPIMLYLHTLSDIALGRSLAVTPGSFLASAHRELSVAHVQSQGYVYRLGLRIIVTKRPISAFTKTAFIDVITL
jgi:hypothetical protein